MRVSVCALAVSVLAVFLTDYVDSTNARGLQRYSHLTAHKSYLPVPRLTLDSATRSTGHLQSLPRISEGIRQSFKRRWKKWRRDDVFRDKKWSSKLPRVRKKRNFKRNRRWKAVVVRNHCPVNTNVVVCRFFADHDGIRRLHPSIRVATGATETTEKLPVGTYLYFFAGEECQGEYMGRFRVRQITNDGSTNDVSVFLSDTGNGVKYGRVRQLTGYTANTISTDPVSPVDLPESPEEETELSPTPDSKPMNTDLKGALRCDDFPPSPDVVVSRILELSLGDLFFQQVNLPLLQEKIGSEMLEVNRLEFLQSVYDQSSLLLSHHCSYNASQLFTWARALAWHSVLCGYTDKNSPNIKIPQGFLAVYGQAVALAEARAREQHQWIDHPSGLDSVQRAEYESIRLHAVNFQLNKRLSEQLTPFNFSSHVIQSQHTAEEPQLLNSGSATLGSVYQRTSESALENAAVLGQCAAGFEWFDLGQQIINGTSAQINCCAAPCFGVAVGSGVRITQLHNIAPFPPYIQTNLLTSVIFEGSPAVSTCTVVEIEFDESSFVANVLYAVQSVVLLASFKRAAIE